MTVKETLETVYQGNDDLVDFEVWRYADRTRRLHTDFIDNINAEYGIDVYGDWEVIDYHIMDEEEYDNTICCNGCIRADFSEWYGKKEAKVLVIMVG